MELDRILIISHADFDPMASVDVGFDDEKNFFVKLEFDYSEDHSLDSVKTAVLDKDNAYLLAKRNKVSLLGLLDLLDEKFGYDGYVDNTSRVVNVFADVVDFLLDCGVNYRVE